MPTLSLYTNISVPGPSFEASWYFWQEAWALPGFGRRRNLWLGKKRKWLPLIARNPPATVRGKGIYLTKPQAMAWIIVVWKWNNLQKCWPARAPGSPGWSLLISFWRISEMLAQLQHVSLSGEQQWRQLVWRGRLIRWQTIGSRRKPNRRSTNRHTQVAVAEHPGYFLLSEASMDSELFSLLISSCFHFSMALTQKIWVFFFFWNV